MARFWRFSDGTNNYDVPKRETYITLENLVNTLFANDEDRAAEIKSVLRENNLLEQKINLANSDFDNYKTATDNAINQLRTSTNSSISALNNMIAGSFSNVYLDDGYLVLVKNDGSETERLGPFSGGGGGGGGGVSGPTNNATFNVQNTTGFMSAKVVQGKKVEIKFRWESTEDGYPTGVGEAVVEANNKKKTYTIEQGDQAIDISNVLSLGENVVKLTVKDTYGNSKTMKFSITVLDLSITSPFDPSTIIQSDEEFLFYYVPVGSVEKTVHCFVDGTEIGTQTVLTTGRQQSFKLPTMTHGSHKLTIYFEADIDGSTVRSNTLEYDLTVVAADGNTPVITAVLPAESFEQFDTALFTYKVYHPATLNAPVIIKCDGTILYDITVGRSLQSFAYKCTDAGDHTITIECSGQIKTLKFHVNPSSVDIQAEQNDLELFLTSYGRSNFESNPAKWSYKNIESQMTGFNYKTNGWVDKKGSPALKVSDGAQVFIPFRIFERDFRATGKTIEIEFSVDNVRNYDSTVISCWSGGRGFKFTALDALVKTERVSVGTDYKDDEKIRLSVVYGKLNENRMINIFIDAVWSGMIQYPSDDDFSQAAPVGITIGSNDATTYIYNMRVYNSSLTNEQLLTNFIADAPSGSEMISRYTRNNIFDDYNNIIIDKLPKDLPYCTIVGESLPSFKGDKKTVTLIYVDPLHPEKSFVAENVQIDVQGTSSQGYAVKNYKVKCKNGFQMDNQTVSKYQINEDAVPTSTFCFKADVASCEGANNLQLVRIYNDLCPYKTPAQKSNPKIRQGIDGHGMVVFWDNGVTIDFLGKYNFNNDKSTEEVYGLKDGDESWEFKNNTSSRVLFKSDDFTSMTTDDNGKPIPEWTMDFEARYPEDNLDCTKLHALMSWVVSTKGNIAKFKNEFEDHFVLEDTIFYYLYTHFYLLVDSRAKNCFLTYLSDIDRWIWLPYDFDTALGINNEGVYQFDYNLEDTDTFEGENVFNGQDSLLWNNFREAYGPEISAMYKSLRTSSGNKFNYETIDKIFTDHQSIFPEAIWNEDVKRKYLWPTINENTAIYMPMVQGKKEQRRRRWLMNRFRYFDSKYHTGYDMDSSEVAILRAYNKADITVVPLIDMYVNIQYGSYMSSARAPRNIAVTLPCLADQLSDTEVHIYSASQITDLGDLSKLNVGMLNISPCTKLVRLKVGDGDPNYQNTKLESVVLTNNVMLKFVDFRNCVKLGSGGAPIDLSACEALEDVLFEGSAITGVTLPPAGNLKTLHLPNTITNLTIQNHKSITDFKIAGTSNITTLRIENTPAIDPFPILKTMQPNGRIRLIGFELEMSGVDEIYEFVELVDKFRGLDENGANTDKAQISGTIHVDTISRATLKFLKQNYPYITITYDNYTADLVYKSEDGTVTYHTETLTNGADGKYNGTSTKDSTQQYYYTFAGWSTNTGGPADPNATKNVVDDRVIYAAFDAHLQAYTARYWLGNKVLAVVPNQLYGTKPTCPVDVSELVDPELSGNGFRRWTPDNSAIYANTDYYADFKPEIRVEEIKDSLSTFLSKIHNCTDPEDVYYMGNYIKVPVGSKTVALQIVAFNRDLLTTGKKGKVTLLCKDVYDVGKMNNITGTQIFKYITGPSWRLATNEANTYYTNIEYCENAIANASWTLTASTATTVTLSYASRSADTNVSKLTITVDGKSVITNAAPQNGGAYAIKLTSGQSAVVSAKWENLTTDYQYAHVTFEGTGFTFTANIEDSTIRVSDGHINGAVDGWQGSYMRTATMSEIKAALPSELQAAVQRVVKTQYTFNHDGTRSEQTTTDELFIPSEVEIYNPIGQGGIYTHFFLNAADRIKKKAGGSDPEIYWTRTARTTKAFTTVVANGNLSYANAESDLGIVFGMVIN